MGRHRSDPRGLARILIAVVAVVAALALLVVGGIALVSAVSGEPDQQGPVTSGTPTPGEDGGDGGDTATADPTADPTADGPPASVPLVIRVTGEPTTVVVRVADAEGRVLTNGRLGTGETLQYDQAPLQVVASNGGSLTVTIHGEEQPPKPDGQRGQWFVGDES